jgi:hypothetical protein
MRDIMAATVHPQKGYLNTRFSIHNNNDSTLSFSIKNEGKVVMTTEVQANDKQDFFANLSGEHIVYFSDGSKATFYVEDALRFGGSSYKRSFIFDKCPWCFVVMRDRTYVYNRITQEAYMESVSPDEITAISEDYVIFINKQSLERTIYSLKEQRPEIVVKNVIFSNAHLIVFTENKEDFTILHGYSLDKHTECFYIESKKYVVDSDNSLLSYIQESGLFVRDLETGFENSIKLPITGTFITFIENQLVFVKYREGIYHIWSLVDKEFLGAKSFKNLACVQRVQLIDLTDRWNAIHRIDLTKSNCPEAVAVADYVELQIIPMPKDVFFIEKHTHMVSNNWNKTNGRSSRLTSLKTDQTIDLNGWWFGAPTIIDNKKIIEDKDTKSSKKRYIILSPNSTPEISEQIPCAVINSTSINAVPKRFGYPSESGRYSLGVEDTKVILCDYSLEDVERIAVLEDLFDATGFKNVYLSEDGKAVIYSESDGQALFDTETGETIKFGKQSFVNSIYGFRPTFTREGSRKPRLINPATGCPIDLSIVSQFKFTSPDGTLYSDGELRQYEKYYDEIRGVYISNEEYNDIAAKYNFGNAKKDDIMSLRKYFVAEHLAFFKNKFSHWASRSDEEWIKVLIDGNTFTDNFISKRGFAMIRSTETKEILKEISLGPALWFLNYVSFSYDSRYIAIAGRYPNHTQYEGRQVGGLLLIYDLKKSKEIYRKTDSHAVWTTSFTPDGHVGAYSSNPITFVADTEQSVELKTINGFSFLSFSPDGRYMALSRQGYIPYNNGKGSLCAHWGHRSSSEVFIYPVTNAENQEPLAYFNDLSDSGLEGVFTRIHRESSKSVASVSFSKDNSRLMMVGLDGVIIIRNLHLDHYAGE